MLKSMLARLRETRLREVEGVEAADAGFTLIELMVVLLIIAILLAIAIPTFLGVTGSANDRAAQSNNTNALTEVKALYQNGQSYNTTSLPAATLLASAPEFAWTQAAACAAATVNCISEEPVDVVAANDGQGVILANSARPARAGTPWTSRLLRSPRSAPTPPPWHLPGTVGDRGHHRPGERRRCSPDPGGCLLLAGGQGCDLQRHQSGHGRPVEVGTDLLRCSAELILGGTGIAGTSGAK